MTTATIPLNVINDHDKPSVKVDGLILYRGPSVIDGSPIVVVATGISRSSKNVKTGNMIQTWIIRSDIPPHHAAQIGLDYSVCGNCRHRPDNDNTCYVKVFQAPVAVWKKVQRDGYPDATPDHIKQFIGKNIRVGSYGDPAAVPYETWLPYLKVAKNWTAYTHQWDNPTIDQRYRLICMASADTQAEADKAINKGWRVFYVGPTPDDRPDGFIGCPASAEQGKRLTCEQCCACRGNPNGRGASVYIAAHGSPWKVKRVRDIAKNNDYKIVIGKKRKEMRKELEIKYANIL